MSKQQLTCENALTCLAVRRIGRSQHAEIAHQLATSRADGDDLLLPTDTIERHNAYRQRDSGMACSGTRVHRVEEHCHEARRTLAYGHLRSGQDLWLVGGKNRGTRAPPTHSLLGNSAQSNPNCSSHAPSAYIFLSHPA